MSQPVITNKIAFAEDQDHQRATSVVAVGLPGPARPRSSAMRPPRGRCTARLGGHCFARTAQRSLPPRDDRTGHDRDRGPPSMRRRSASEAVSMRVPKWPTRAAAPGQDEPNAVDFPRYRSTPTPATALCSATGSAAGLKVRRQLPAGRRSSALRASDSPRRRCPSCVPSSSDADDEFDARLSRLQKSLRLPVIAPIQRPAGILPTAFRAAEGEVVNLSHLSSATASPAGGSSSMPPPPGWCSSRAVAGSTSWADVRRAQAVSSICDTGSRIQWERGDDDCPAIHA